MPPDPPPMDASSLLDALGGVTGVHPDSDQFPVLVAPMIAGKGKNSIRMELIPVACWKVNDVRFAFGSSFVLPEARGEFQELAKIRKDHPGAPLSLFGHADPTGDDALNKGLSGRRAMAVYAALLRDAGEWEVLYHEGGQGEGWGTSSIQMMLTSCGFHPGPADGVNGPKTQKAAKEFQTANGLLADGLVGPVTRAKLFAAYMDFLCPEKLTGPDFLGKGADPGGKGSVQGCGEFNPMMVFSQAEQQSLSQPSNKSTRDTQNSVNRRVMALLFRPGTSVPVDRWPCPRTNEGSEGCQKRFWSDGQKRRSPQGAHREFGQTQDTFACRFYHRLVVHSPCEGVAPPPGKLSHWIEIELVDTGGLPLADVLYRIQMPDGGTTEGKLDKAGKARVQKIAGGVCQVTFPELDGSAWSKA